MKDLNELNQYRLNDYEQYVYGQSGDDGNGVFGIPYYIPPFRGGPILRVIASNGMGWDHVSVSHTSTPTWEMMDYVKRMFFKDEEVVMQLHVATKDHINIHNNCLHLWRPQVEKIPTPNKALV